MYCILSKIAPTLLYMYTNTYTVDRYHYYIYIILYYIILYIIYYILYIYIILYILYISLLTNTLISMYRNTYIDNYLSVQIK